MDNVFFIASNIHYQSLQIDNIVWIVFVSIYLFSLAMLDKKGLKKKKEKRTDSMIFKAELGLLTRHFAFVLYFTMGFIFP